MQSQSLSAASSATKSGIHSPFLFAVKEQLDALVQKYPKRDELVAEFEKAIDKNLACSPCPQSSSLLFKSTARD